jgi:hypothetical protein
MVPMNRPKCTSFDKLGRHARPYGVDIASVSEAIPQPAQLGDCHVASLLAISLVYSKAKRFRPWGPT